MEAASRLGERLSCGGPIAKALGLMVPVALRVRADEAIE